MSLVVWITGSGSVRLVEWLAGLWLIVNVDL